MMTAIVVMSTTLVMGRGIAGGVRHATMRDHGCCRIEPDFGVVVAVAIDLEELSGHIFFRTNVDGEMRITLQAGKILTLPVVEEVGHVMRAGDIDAPDVLTVGRQGEDPHDFDRHALG